jgi:hypothetical protein
MLRGEGEVTAVDPHPCQVLKDRGPDRGVIACLLQGSLREPLDATHVEPADGGQAKEDAGAVTARLRCGDRLLQQPRRAGRVAGVEMEFSCPDASSKKPRAVPGWCQLPRQLQQLGGRVRGSPPARVPACLLQRSCHAEVWSAGRKRKMPSPLLRVGDQVRQAAMHASFRLRRGCSVDGRPQERMGERDPAVGSLQNAGLLGPPDSGRRPVRSCRRHHQTFRRAGRRRHDEEPISGARRERGKPDSQQRLQVLRNGQGFARSWPEALPGEGPSDLEGEERVPFRDPVEPDQDGMREIPLGPGLQKPGHGLLAQRADGHPLEARRRPYLTQAERVAAGTDAERHQDLDRRILQTTNHERQHPGRGRIQPLDVVDRDDHRIGRGQRAQHSQRCDRHRSLVRWSTFDLSSEERGVQRALLRSREIG